MVDRLAFVKTVEAILASVVAMSIYTFLQSQSLNQVQTPTRSMAPEISDFVNKVINPELIGVVKNYDYLMLDSLFNRLFFEASYYYFEPVYYEKTSVTSNYNKTYPNISMVYHFPQGTDENSVRIIQNGYELNTQALFNWYFVPVTFNETIIDENIKFNVTMQSPNINNNSLKFFINGKESLLSINYWSNDSASANATITVYIPELGSNDNCYVYFARNNGFINITYPSLSNARTVIPTISITRQARTAEVIFTPPSINSTSSDYYIKYSLFTSEDDNYNRISLVNNTGVSIEAGNELKDGSVPFSTTIKGQESFKKIIPLANGFVELRIYGG